MNIRLKASLILTLVFLLFAKIFYAQQFYIAPDYFNSFYSEYHQKLILGNKATNLVLDINSDLIDTLLPGSRIMASQHDTSHLIFEQQWKKGLANWNGEILIEPKYNKIYRAERLGGYTAALGNKVYAIPWNGYQGIEIGSDIEKVVVRFVEDKIGVSPIALNSGGLILNINGDTLFNYLGKSNAYLREDFPKLLTVSPFNYQPGFKFIDVNTGSVLADFPELKQKTLRVGDHLRIELNTPRKYTYLSPEGKLVEAGTPVLLKSVYDWKVYENCDPEQQRNQTLMKGDSVMVDCSSTFFEFLEAPKLISYRFKNNGYTYFNKEGKVLIDGSSSKFCKHLDRDANFFLSSADGLRFEVMDRTGITLFAVDGNGHSFFSSFRTYTVNGKPYFVCSKRTEHLVLDAQGKILFQKPRHLASSAPRLFYHSWIWKNEQSNFEIMDLSGLIIKELKNAKVQFKGQSTNSRFFIFSEENKTSVYDLKTHSVILKGFEQIKSLRDKYFLVKTAELYYGVIKTPD